jgi:hypothetical protein
MVVHDSQDEEKLLSLLVEEISELADLPDSANATTVVAAPRVLPGQDGIRARGPYPLI